MADFENAVLYVDKHGNEVQTEFLRCILNEVPARAATIDTLVQDQAQDGHFPAASLSASLATSLSAPASASLASFLSQQSTASALPLTAQDTTVESSTASEIETTCRRLEILRYLFVSETSPAIHRALDWLAESTQAITTASIHNTLVRYSSIDLNLRIAWTMKLWGSETVRPKGTEKWLAPIIPHKTLNANLSHETDCLDGTTAQPITGDAAHDGFKAVRNQVRGDVHNQVDYGVRDSAHETASDPVQRYDVLVYAAALSASHEQELILAQLFTVLDDMRAPHLAMLLNTLLDAGVSPDHKLLSGAADRLELLQAADGSFQDHPHRTETNPTETTFQTATTLLALRALLRCERFESHPFFN